MNMRTRFFGVTRIARRLALTALVFGMTGGLLLFAVPAAHAAVPTWTVGFDENTNYEKSLEVFMYNLFRDLQERQEEFQLSLELSKISKAREDVNKLIYEAFVELRSEPLMIEFRKIVKQCETANDTNFIENCQLTNQLVESLKGRGIEISVEQTALDAVGPDHVASKADVAALCPYGVRTAEGECIVVKQDGRIITNADDFVYEEPIQKARDFIQCYLAPWRHFPFSTRDKSQCNAWGLQGPSECTTLNVCSEMQAQGQKCQSDQLRDQIKETFLLDINRKLSALETSPPPEFYTPARCEIILYNLQCPALAGLSSTLGRAPSADNVTSGGDSVDDILEIDPNSPEFDFSLDDITQIGPIEEIDIEVRSRMQLFLNQSRACQFRTIELAPELKEPLGQFFTWDQLDKAVNDRDSTVMKVIGRIQQTISEIIADYEQLRLAQYVSGQGLKPEKYLIGFQSYTPDEHKELVTNIAKGVPEDEKENPATGDFYYIDTEDIISPTVILLNKIQAATQAQFDLAAQAFQSPRILNATTGEVTITNDEVEAYREQPENAFGFSPARGGKTVDGQTIDAQGDLIGIRVKDGRTSLPAPFEDTNIKLPAGYLTGELPRSIYEDPALRGNYFNQWYKDVLQLHQQNFSTIVKQWFRQPDKGYFIPDR
ncbi:MAG: hypothetical protein A2666_01065 [Parcubacteria group bacterium RIFCSPHIGHO2_01_FULL_47_10b]|nr:MAG: hypothetical protein A2666_01065 [Parcubacteria group bacterium RIFCSPHIGHO2_01_FULL_47_10b]